MILNNHKESLVKVFITDDYAKFRMITGNRSLNETKIRRIELDIKNGLDVLKYCPILVTENNSRLDIIDGQHRFWVTKKMKCPVYYIITEKITLQGIAKINSNTEKWKPEDFLNCYSQLDNENYKGLQYFKDKYNLPLTTAVTLLARGFLNSDSGGLETKKFQAGEFKIMYPGEAELIVSTAKRFSAFPFWKNRHFITAISKIIENEKCDINELVDKFQRDTERLEKQSDYKSYLTALENIYNKGAHSRRVIY